jgi:hypothetical protein
MANDNSGQGQLFKKVININEVRPQDKKTGQQKLFGQVEEFAPGFNEWAGLMQQKLVQTQDENERLRGDITENTAQSKRLANSLELVIPKFIEQSVNHTNPDIVFGHLPEGKEADVAIADGTSIAAEALYTLSAGDIAKRVGNDKMSPSQIGISLRRLKIFGNPFFHHEKKHGNTLIQCYKPCVIDEVYKRVADPEAFNLDVAEVAKIVNRLKPREVVSA